MAKVKITIERGSERITYEQEVESDFDITELMDRCEGNLTLLNSILVLRRIGRGR